MLPEKLFVLSKNGVPNLVCANQQWLLDNGTTLDVKWVWMDTLAAWIATDNNGNMWTVKETLVVPE